MRVGLCILRLPRVIEAEQFVQLEAFGGGGEKLFDYRRGFRVGWRNSGQREFLYVLMVATGSMLAPEGERANLADLQGAF